MGVNESCAAASSLSGPRLDPRALAAAEHLALSRSAKLWVLLRLQTARRSEPACANRARLPPKKVFGEQNEKCFFLRLGFPRLGLHGLECLAADFACLRRTCASKPTFSSRKARARREGDHRDASSTGGRGRFSVIPPPTTFLFLFSPGFFLLPLLPSAPLLLSPDPAPQSA